MLNPSSSGVAVERSEPVYRCWSCGRIIRFEDLRKMALSSAGEGILEGVGTEYGVGMRIAIRCPHCNSRIIVKVRHPAPKVVKAV